MLKTDFINRIYPLPPSAMQKLVAIAEPINFNKGAVIFEESKAEKFLYIIQSGVARAYKMHEGSEITFWFGLEGDSIISIKNYVQGTKSYETIEALEPILAYKINTDALKKLFETDIYIANWGRCYAENEMLKTEERLISRQFKSATERYLELLTTQPEIIKRVALRHIASYLGITQVSLSRIRSELK
ncbi:Crp/Fnr family transcriptional regulator [Flavobacterium agricola]|uniref:Crp/Fnr family transcriptional regulator n=1 Tax=Flavobacterium agricola TaxID=2870839 RepID=A0ABY6LXS3_9FLAO|nr:Crp/Fnr family transcriptional regulator [Flavobacterium agricola]UYW00976.1 Crp/Fnr family transcriptional regulator [Flavobacterium agricola]